MQMPFYMHMRQRLQGLLQVPTDAQVQRAVSIWVAADVAGVITSYANLPTPDLLHAHLSQARTDFLSLSEISQALNWLEFAPCLTPVFLQYLERMFAGMPALHKWPFLLRYRACRLIIKPRCDWDWDLCGRVQALKRLQERLQACHQRCHVQRYYLRDVLMNAQTLASVLPQPGSALGKRYQVARRLEMWAYIGLSVAIYSLICFIHRMIGYMARRKVLGI